MKQMKYWAALISIFMAFSVLAACNANNGTTGQDNNDGSVGMNRARTGGDTLGQFRNDRFQDRAMNRGSNLANGDHNNSRLESSQEIAEQVAAINGVESAYVLLTDRNAYVAVIIDEDEDYGRKGQLGMDLGRQNRSSVKGTSEGARHGTDLQFGEYHTMRDGLTQAMKNRIGDKVKSLKPELRNVYVSASPDFLSRVQNYVSKIDEGEPIEGLIEEFNTMVQRLFPQEAGSHAGLQRDQMNRP